MTDKLIAYNQEQIDLIRNTVAKDATNNELMLFLEFCKSTKLNPFKREIWFIKTPKNGVQIMTGIAGFLTIANAHPQFDGMEVSLQEEGGKLISATAKVYRKDRKFPSVATVYLKEYYKPSYSGKGLWDTMPRMMLQKVAKSVALREAFSQELNGLYTQEEMPPEYAEPAQVEEVKQEAPVLPAPTFTYNLSLLDSEKFQKAVAWCERHNIETVWQDLPNGESAVLVTTNYPVPFFKEIEINANNK